MTRALSLTCLALFMVGLAGSSALAAKPSIAVLGLEVVDPSGTPTAQDTQVAKELTDGLRGRAKAGTGQYQLAPGSDKELIDQKLLNNCDNEAAGCMSAIGNQLGADMLMDGKIQKEGKAYQVTLKVLDVGRKSVHKSSSDLIPLSSDLTVRLPEDLKRAVDEASHAMQRKSSEIVRMALRAFLQTTPRPEGRPADRTRDLLGSLESGVPHLAEQHRAYVIESLKNGR